MIQLNMVCPLCSKKTEVLKVVANGSYAFQFYCANCGGGWTSELSHPDYEHEQSFKGSLEVSIERAENVAMKAELLRLTDMEERLTEVIVRLRNNPAPNRVESLIDELEFVHQGWNRHGTGGKIGVSGTSANGTIDY